MNNEVTLGNVLPPSFDHLPTLKRWLMKSLAKIHHGTLYVHMEGHCYACGNDDSIIAHLNIHHPLKMAWRCLTKGDMGVAEGYLEGDWSSDGLTQLLTLFLRNRGELGNTYGGKSLLRIAANVYHKLRKNSIKGSRKNIQYHYDLGNDFYQLWLDKSMTYSSALFTSKVSLQTAIEDQSLELAQENKYQRILNEIDAKENQLILEVGCGWGGFAEKAVDQGCTVHGITLSQEQLDYANKRLAHVNDKAHLEIKDYREVDQQYDHIVSIEMFEAVGEQYWQTYFEMLKRSLKPNGKIVLQIITIKDEYFKFYKSRADFIQRYIFPGGMLPSEEILTDLVNENGLQITNRIGFGHDYGETLARWEQNFLKVIPEMEAIGYDKRFQRMWRYYLGYCQAGFEEERIDVVQLTLTHSSSVIESI
ncbi:MAG: cyclopropane-fatty-acyl-phospholipid synthase family protein [Cocleimonas sp.]